MKLETTPCAAGEVEPLKIRCERYRKHLTQRAGDRLTIWKRRADLTARPPEERPGHTITRANGQPFVSAGILVSMMPAPHERIHRESAADRYRLADIWVLPLRSRACRDSCPARKWPELRPWLVLS